MWHLFNPALTTLLALVAAFTAYQAMITSRTPQGAVGWVVFILGLPVLAIPIYAIFGYANYNAFAAQRQALDEALTIHWPKKPSQLPPQSRLKVFERLAGVSAERGNGIDLLIDGQAMLEAIFQTIAEAEDYLLLQFYMIRDDSCGRALKKALIARAQAGVAVYVLHDAFRGVGLPYRFVRDLRQAGVRIRAPRGPRRALGRLQINHRSHRKMVIADGRVAYTGGQNIGEEYLGLNRRYGSWRDTFARLKGPVVQQMQRSFVADWLWASGEDLRARLVWGSAQDTRDMRALILSPAPTDPIKTGNLYFCALANAARRRLWIATPYFVPDTEVMSALKLAALRGIELRILVPDNPDHILPWITAFSYFDELRAVGGEIWRYRTGFMHQKVALVDDDLVSVGTINLDIRSGLLNFEQTAIFEDRRAAQAVAAMLQADFARAFRMEARLKDQPPLRRLAARPARLLAPLM